jgi:4-amino-4-deoxy-L-arabinose transferase-like glycosyltransferase
MTARRVWVAQLLAIMFVAAAAWGIAHRDLPWTFLTGDEAEYAEVARRLADGRGFTTGIIYPIEIQWGVHEQHPSLLRAPMWPLTLAAVFLWTGPEEAAAIATAAVCHVVTSGLIFALGFALAGPWAGLAAGVAVATSPDVLLYAQLGASETLFGLLIAVFFVLLAHRVDAFWIGLACGLAYLTRYNGGLLLVVAGVLIALRQVTRPVRPFQAILRLGLGFALVAGPWWLRNFIVTGDPIYSLYGVTLHFSPKLLPPNGSLIYMIEPDLNSPAAMDPLDKLRLLLPTAFAHWPLWTPNAVACAGWLLGCIRREKLSLSLLGVAVVTTVVISTMALRGRYLIPFIPVMIGLGSAAWIQYGGRLRYPALMLMLLAPLAPTFPEALFDTRLAHQHLDQVRERMHSGSPIPDSMASKFASCLGSRPLVIAQNGAAVNWASNSVTLHMTRTDEDFWRLVGDYPVEYVRLQPKHRLLASPRFLERFARSPECGSGVYRRSPTRASGP